MKRTLIFGWLLLVAAGSAMVVIMLLPRPEEPPETTDPTPTLVKPPEVPPPPFGRTDPRQQILYMGPLVQPAPPIDLRLIDIPKLEEEIRQRQGR